MAPTASAPIAAAPKATAPIASAPTAVLPIFSLPIAFFVCVIILFHCTISGLAFHHFLRRNLKSTDNPVQADARRSVDVGNLDW
jgi:hypothetical protein